jgi:hypothetical protein
MPASFAAALCVVSSLGVGAGLGIGLHAADDYVDRSKLLSALLASQGASNHVFGSAVATILTTVSATNIADFAILTIA